MSHFKGGEIKMSHFKREEIRMSHFKGEEIKTRPPSRGRTKVGVTYQKRINR
jgi:hypothetical protein